MLGIMLFSAALFGLVMLLHRGVYKFMLRLYRGRGELEHQLATLPAAGPPLTDDVLDAAAVDSVVADMKRSQVLRGVITPVSKAAAPFDVPRVAAEIVTRKVWEPALPGFQRALSRLNNILYALNGMSIASMVVRTLKSRKVDTSQPAVRAALTDIWQAAAAHAGAVPPLEHEPGTAEERDAWMVLGFQGQRPQQDFRTGQLALLQLHALSESDAGWCADLVKRTEVPYKGLPLVLVSMSVTEWLATLLHEQVLSPWPFTAVGLLWEVGLAAKPARPPPPTSTKRVTGPYELPKTSYPPDALLAEAAPKAARAVAAASQGAPAEIEAPPAASQLFPTNPGEGLALATLNAVHGTVMRSFAREWFADPPPDLMHFDMRWKQWRSHKGLQVANAAATAFAKQVMSGQGMSTAVPLPGEHPEGACAQE